MHPEYGQRAGKGKAAERQIVGKNFSRPLQNRCPRADIQGKDFFSGVGGQMIRIMRGGMLALGMALGAAAQAIELPDAGTIEAQMQVYRQLTPGSVFALQPFRASQTAEGADGVRYRLTSLNPAVNSWFVLEVMGNRGRPQAWHLQNADPARWQIDLAPGPEPALVITGDGAALHCTPWAGEAPELAAARARPLPYAPICDGRLYLRNKVRGSRTNREAMAEFLRNNILFGDSIVNLIKGTFYEDAFMSSSQTTEGEDAGATVAALGQAMLERAPQMYVKPEFELEGLADGRMQAGAWYAVKDAPGIYASVVQPGMISKEILSRKDGANWLDNVERRADVLLVAFDMARFEMGYELGTAHPGFGWSSRPKGAGRDWRIPGPDGFDRPEPLVMTGMVPPALTDRVAATFTGGFKRDHGAFRAGPMSTSNHGTHYGFMVDGVVLSKLWPGLMTMIVTRDGRFEMKVWDEADTARLGDIRFARQNGVPILEPDPETGRGVSGKLLTNWGWGNWSGSAEAQLRTLRAGACVKRAAGRQFLIYAYFSTATPSAMARTFQAYGCESAMLLDMNSQEHTYMALYPQAEGGDWIEARHLVPLMREVDQRRRDGSRIPRFVGYADNRDFFYLLRKD